MSDIIQVLTRLGFTEYEAKAYVTLLQRNPLNGYELARESQLPRANIYPVLERLESRGAVTRLETPAGTRYVPIPPAELTQRLNSQLQAALTEAEGALSSISQAIDYEYIWNTRGYAALLEHAQSLLDGAQSKLLIALSPPESLALQRNLDAAAGRGVEVTTLCLRACEEECGRCKGQIFRYRIAPEAMTRWFIVVMDDNELLAGQIGASDDTQAMRTRQRLLVNLAAGYIRRSITLAILLNDLGDPAKINLSASTLSALKALDPSDAGGNWLEHLHSLLEGNPSRLPNHP